MDIPVDLKNALETGNCVLFVGAGMGYNMVNGENNQIPDGKLLAPGLDKQKRLSAMPSLLFVKSIKKILN